MSVNLKIQSSFDRKEADSVNKSSDLPEKKRLIIKGMPVGIYPQMIYSPCLLVISFGNQRFLDV